MTMTADQILKDAQIAFTALQALINLGQDEAPALTALWQTLVLKKSLTDSERATLLANHQAMTDALQAPLPDETAKVALSAPASFPVSNAVGGVVTDPLAQPVPGV